MLKTYTTVIPAHNEEEYLPSVLEALQFQTLKPSQIIVVNDGSTDKTGDIARDFGCIVVDLPFHEKNWRGLPQLAGVINAGLRHVGEDDEYVMILGADHIIPPKYAETIISRMKMDPSLVIASGVIKEDKMRRTGPPRGSGRVVRLNFWRPLGFHYPENYGWESWLIFKALQLGYQIKKFDDIESNVLRPTVITYLYGKGMRALGYWKPYAIGRCVRLFPKNPKAALRVFWDWLSAKDIEEYDVANWVKEHQKKVFWTMIRKVAGL